MRFALMERNGEKTGAANAGKAAWYAPATVV